MKTYSKKKDKQYGGLAFFISLIISFCILGSCFLLFVTYVNKTVDKKQLNVPYETDSHFDYSPSHDEDMTVLLLAGKSPNDAPCLVSLFYYNAPKGSLSIITMPPQTVCTNANGRRDTVIGHYDYEGLAGSCNAIKSLFSIEFDRYLRLQKDGLSNMTDFLGGLPYIINEEKVIDGERLLKGEQMLDGRRFRSLLFEQTVKLENSIGLSNQAKQAELLQKLIQRSFTKDFIDKYESLATAIFFNGETNISQYDFDKRKTGFLNRLKHDNLAVNSYSLKGIYNRNYTEFIPNAESIKDVIAIF